MCQQMAKQLDSLRQSYISQGKTDIQFYIINMRSWHSRLKIGLLRQSVSFPVYQDTRRKNIFHRMRGGKDDVFMYDRCGKQTHFIPFPFSLMRRGNTQHALNQTYYVNSCNCSVETDNTTKMQGDQPDGHFGAYSQQLQHGQRGNHRSRRTVEERA